LSSGADRAAPLKRQEGVAAVHDIRRTHIVIAVLLVVILTLLAVGALRGSAPLRTLDAAGASADRAVRSVAGPVAGFLRRGTGSTTRDQSASALKRDLIRLRAQLSNGGLSRGQYSRLAVAPRIPATSRHHVIGADVIAVTRGTHPTIELDVGKREGISQNTTVLNSSGLVGTVISVRQWTCTVQPPTAQGAVVGVRLSGSGRLGWVTGTTSSAGGQPLLALRLFGAARPVTPGERLVTFASIGDRPYVAGVPVGVVTAASSGGPPGTAMVRPFADFAALGTVGVVVRRGGRR
jgi:rod shape-determining protein MreC